MSEKERIRDPRKVRIGHWRYVCCQEDLGRIKDKGELAYTRENMDPKGDFFYRVYARKPDSEPHRF